MGLQQGWIAGTGPFFVGSSAINVAYDQAGFRGRNDDGNETTATWKAAENTGWSQAVDENFRFRAVIDETAGGILNAVLDFKLQYNLNGAGWNDVNTTSLVVRTFASPNVTNGEATTRQLTSGTGPFVAGSIDENNGAAGTANTIDSGELTEIEWVVQIRSVDVANNDTIQLRVVETVGSVPFAAYTQVPTVTVSEPGAVNQAFVLDDEFIRRAPQGEFETAISLWEVTQPPPAAPDAVPVLGDEYIRPLPIGEFDAALSLWEVNQPQAPPAPDGVANFGLDDRIARPVPGGEFDSWVSFWEVNQPAAPTAPDAAPNLFLDDRLIRPYVPAEFGYWIGQPAVPDLSWQGLDDSLTRPIPRGEWEAQVSFWEITQPAPAPDLAWQGLRDDLPRPLPRGEWDAVWYPFIPPAPPADVFITEGDTSPHVGIEGRASKPSSTEPRSSQLVSIEPK